MNKNLSATFDFLRFPLALMVIFLHISPVVSTFDNPYSAIKPNSYLYINMLINKIATCAVPTFFFISGYLLITNIQNLSLAVYLSKLKKRFTTLFIPYIIWNLLAVIYLYFTNQFNKPFTFNNIFLSPANFPLWFLRDLMIMTLAFPAFYYVAKLLGKYMTILSVALFIIIPMPNMTVKYIFLPIIFFYTGISASLHNINLNSCHNYLKLLIVLSCLFCLYIEIIFNGEIAWSIDNLFLVLGVFSFLIIGHLFVSNHNWQYIKTLSLGSFFIYCSHKLGPTYISKTILYKLPISPYYKEIAIFLLAPFLTYSICLLIYHLGKKYSPSFIKLLTGGK